MNWVRVFLLVFIVALGACSPDESSVQVDLDRVETLVPPRETESITYAYLPQYSHSVSFERHRRLLEYLRQKTGLSFRQVYPDTFGDHIKMVERGEIDISFTNPFVYIRMARFGATAFARVVEPDSGADFHGQIIVRSDNPAIVSIADCRDKRLIAVDQNSAGGYLYPLGLFDEHGIGRHDFKEVSFAAGSGGRQESVVLAVYAGAYDVGTIRKGTLDVVRDKIDVDQIRVLAETKPYPGWVYSTRQGLDVQVCEQVAKAFFELDPTRAADLEILTTAGFVGIIPAQDQDYDPVRELTQRLHLDETER